MTNNIKVLSKMTSKPASQTMPVVDSLLPFRTRPMSCKCAFHCALIAATSTNPGSTSIAFRCFSKADVLSLFEA